MTDKLARTKLARAARRLNADSSSALPALVLMTDDARLADPVAAARALPRGSMVILRTRDAAKRRALAELLRPIAKARAIRLLIADDAPLAARIAADGIHLPEAKARQAARWRALRPHWIITAAAHSLRGCAIPFADAVLLSPVFATASHPDASVLGPTKLRLLARQSPRPVYALGGITAETAITLDCAPLAGLAAIGGLSA